MNWLTRLINKIENISSSLPQTLLLFATSIFIRTFFENFTNSNNAGVLNSMTDTFLHYPLWYAGVFLSVIVIFYLLTKQDLLKITNVVAIGSFGILLAPAIDIIAHGFLGHPYNFIAGDYATLWQHFRTITFSTSAISLGLKIETVLVILSTGLYVYMRSNKQQLLRAAAAGILSYIALFFFLSLPTHVMSLFNSATGNWVAPTPEATVMFYTPPSYAIDQNFDTQILNKHSQEQKYFSQKISIIFSILITLLLALLFTLKNMRKVRAIVKNMRFPRLAILYLFAGAGLYFSLQANTYSPHSFYTFIDTAALFIAITSAWSFAVWENDEADVVIDSISNPERPLVSGIFTKKQWSQTKYLFLFFALLFGFLAGEYVFTSIAIFILIYHIYSVKPLRLKKIPLLSSILVVLNALLLFIAGFFVGNFYAELYSLPFHILLGILVIYLLVENIKNMKDIAGDRADNIYTIPVLLGKYAPLGMSILVVMASIFTILFFHFSISMIFITVPFVTGIVYALHQKPYRESLIFILFFSLLILLFLNTPGL